MTAEALATRIDARLGDPAVTRDFERNGIRDRSTTPYGTMIELSEDLSTLGRDWLGLRTWSR